MPVTASNAANSQVMPTSLKGDYYDITDELPQKF